MRLHYGGRYESDRDLKSRREHHPNAVAFKEPETKAFAVIANLGSLMLILLLGALVFLYGRPYFSRHILIMGSALSLLTIFPHELLHALCFKRDVYLYLWPAKFLVFIHGTEDFSKARFVFMSLLPNIVFGLLPFIAFLVKHELVGFGVFGTLCLGMGFGDYINAINAIHQMPKGAKTYLYGFHSYWYKD